MSLEVEKNKIQEKTHYIELVYRDEEEYKIAVIFSSIFCKLCNGIALNENNELQITTKNSVRWAKKIIKNGFNLTSTKEDLWINVTGHSAVLVKDLKQLIGKELINITFTGVWGGGLSLSFTNNYSFYSNSWRLISNEKIFDVTNYRTNRSEELKYLIELDASNLSEEEEKKLKIYEKENDKAIEQDELITDKAREELFSWPKNVTVANITWNNRNKISISFNEMDASFELLIIGVLTDIHFRTPNKREFSIKLE